MSHYISKHTVDRVSLQIMRDRHNAIKRELNEKYPYCDWCKRRHQPPAHTYNGIMYVNQAGKNQAAALERYLEKEGIQYFHGDKGPWTTEALLNASKGLGLPEESSEHIL